MDSITRTPSASNEKESPREMNKKISLDDEDTVTLDDPMEDLSNLATKLILEALPEPSAFDPPFDPPSTPDKTQAETKPKENGAKVSVDSYFVRQISYDPQESHDVWNTGYFYDLSTGSGDLWKERSVWASHPAVFATRKKKEAERIAAENRENVQDHAQGCGVLFWGW